MKKLNSAHSHQWYSRPAIRLAAVIACCQIGLQAVAQVAAEHYAPPTQQSPSTSFILKPEIMQRDVAGFIASDSGDIQNYVHNDQSYAWLAANIPLFACPDSTLQEMYYFRWWAFRKHLTKTPYGFIFTEFITRVKFGGPYNAISSALGHQIYEGRWLHNPTYIQQYITYWLKYDPIQKKPAFHRFSSWVDNAVYQLYLVDKDQSFLQQTLPKLAADYKKWETEKQLPSQLFWQFDVRDAMEESISGSRTQKNVRPTINSYMYGNAVALAKMYRVLGQPAQAAIYEKKATTLRQLVQDSLWAAKANFFEVKYPNGQFAAAREAIGFIPWYFNLPADQKNEANAWDQLIDTTGFKAPWGITTAERRHPLFRTHGSGNGCEWDGAVWPYATTQTLKSLSNLLNNYRHKGKMTPKIFYDFLHQYAWAQQKDGKPFIGEYQDERTGIWLRNDPRSRYYNHSGFADLIISDLVGLKPSTGNQLEIKPLIPKNKWDWFCLDNVRYHGHLITVLWDKDGQHFKHGKGLQVFVDGKQALHKHQLKAVTVTL